MDDLRIERTATEHTAVEPLRRCTVTNTPDCAQFVLNAIVLPTKTSAKSGCHGWHLLPEYDCDHFVTRKLRNKEEDIGKNRMKRSAEVLELRRIVGKPLHSEHLQFTEIALLRRGSWV